MIIEIYLKQKFINRDLFQNELYIAHHLFFVAKVCEKFQWMSLVLVQFRDVLPATRLKTKVFIVKEIDYLVYIN